MQNIWFTSDTHFYHKNILKYCAATRQYGNVDEMNEAMIAAWNSVVQPNDKVFHLGDVAFAPEAKTKEVLARLTGEIILIRGNHDRETVKYCRSRFSEIRDYYDLRHGGHRFVLFHFPIAVWDRQHHGAFHLHGHSHGSYPPVGRMMDAGWDAQGRLVHIDEVIERLSKIDVVTFDHHNGERE